MSELDEIAARYRHFSEVEAPGRSPLYVELAAAVGADAPVRRFLAGLPPEKRQPNLLFAAVRYLYGTAADGGEFLRLVRAHEDEIAALMLARRTQTNEPARCATLLPALARLPQPLALLEVGASAGLCLLPDRYGYLFGGVVVGPEAPSEVEAPVFPCRASAGTPIPPRGVQVAWRAGLDLEPIDLGRDSEVRWLEALVWPGQEYRIPRLRAACEIARRHPPGVVRGDLRYDLTALARQAPSDATLVVFHTAVLVYLPDAGEREAFARQVRELGAVWIANDGPEVIPGVSDAVRHERTGADAYLLCVDGHPTAWTDGHGAWIDWRAA